MKVSIIIRTKNEERWISLCLESVFSQKFKSFEVIVIDNESEDATVAKASKYPVKFISIGDFKPGKAINEGIRHSKGEIIICLSAHCIPVNDEWLSCLVEKLSDSTIAGVYGRQQPMSFSTDRDKRDLLTIFGLDAILQEHDTYFHNANSAFRREVWEAFPFDEETPHIEDRLWAHDVISQGFKLYYEPKASVYHYHGVHQDENTVRRRNIVKILENIDHGVSSSSINGLNRSPSLDASELNVVALIPSKGVPLFIGEHPLISYTIEKAKKSKFIDRVIVLTDNEDTCNIAKQYGAEVPFLRPKELSREFVSVVEVLNFGIEQLKNDGIYIDVCVVLEETYPFRPDSLVDTLVERLIRDGVGCALAVKKESRSIWVKKGENLETVSPLIPRKLKSEEFYISLFGLGFATYPAHIRDTSLGLQNPFALPVDDPLAWVEVRDGVINGLISKMLLSS